MVLRNLTFPAKSLPKQKGHMMLPKDVQAQALMWLNGEGGPELRSGY